MFPASARNIQTKMDMSVRSEDSTSEGGTPKVITGPTLGTTPPQGEGLSYQMMSEASPMRAREDVDIAYAVSPRVSFDYSESWKLGGNPYTDRPLMRLHIPKLPSKLDEILESEPTHGEEVASDVVSTCGTKVIVTIGPACQEVEIMCEMIMQGMSCARLDLTNGDPEFHIRSINNIHQASTITKRMVAIMIDTAGPEIFVNSGPPTRYEGGWPSWGSACDVSLGDHITLTTKTDVEMSTLRWPVSYEKFATLCKVGDVLTVGRYLSTGMEGSSVTLEVVSILNEYEVECVALNDAHLSGLITVFIQDKTGLDGDFHIDLPIITERDKKLLKVLGEVRNQGSDCIDFVSLSLIQSADCITQVRQYLDSIGLVNAQIIAKIETKKGLSRFESILKTADGIVISRGNLGIDIPVEKFPILQKALIQACNSAGKPVLTTRVVDSMTSNPRPTRAEATDISNAVIDGIDGIILGAETLRGKFPVSAVKTVLSCAKEAEKTFDNTQHFTTIMKKEGILNQLESMASSAVRVADKIQAAMIVVVTGTGRTARLVSKYRPNVPVIALTVPRIRSNAANKWHFSGRHQARQSMVVRGLYPMLAVGSSDEGTILEDVVQRAARIGLAKPKDHIVVLYNPSASEVPVIKLISMDRFGQNMSRKSGSVAESLLSVNSQMSRLKSASSYGSLDGIASD